jgi:glycosyltransferase involved in cell wall biosynthesis
VNEKLSIAFLSHLASPRAPTGAEHSLALLAGGLSDRGHRVAVVAPGRWALAAPLRSAGVAVETIPSRSCWMTYWEPRPWPVALAKWARCLWPQRATARIAAFLERWRPDVVHVNCLPHLAGAAAAARTTRPVVWHLREILPPGHRRRWLAGKIARHAAVIVAVSEAVARWVRDEGLGERLHVVPNGVAAPGTTPERRRARAALGLEASGVVIGLFGQLVPHKGAIAFIAAAERAAASDRSVRFVLAGAGPAAFRKECEEAIARIPHADRIRLLPAQPTGEELIAASDVVCLATTTPDPFPRAVLEAMAAGRPVAAFDSGGTREMVIDGETGILVPTGDIDALAGALGRLARDGALRSAMGKAGAARVRERFSLEHHVDRMEALLLRASQGAPRA